MAYEQNSLYGSFLPTTRVFDEQNIRELDVNSPEFKEFLVLLMQSINEMSLVTNTKDTGYYVLQEFVNGQLFFPDPSIVRTAADVQTPDYRQVFRHTFNMGALKNAGTTTVAHGIDFNAPIKGTRVYGCATKTDKTSIIPLPYVTNTSTEAVKLEVTNTNINVTTYDDKTAYTNCFVIFEYLRN